MRGGRLFLEDPLDLPPHHTFPHVFDHQICFSTAPLRGPAEARPLAMMFH